MTLAIAMLDVVHGLIVGLCLLVLVAATIGPVVCEQPWTRRGR